MEFQIPSQVASNESVLSVRIIEQKVDFRGLKIEKAGKYNLQARVFKFGASGIYQFFVDGAPIGTPVDLYAARSVKESALSSDPIVDIGPVDLSAGDHILSIALVGHNEKARPSNPAGAFECLLDYLKLEPIQ